MHRRLRPPVGQHLWQDTEATWSCLVFSLSSGLGRCTAHHAVLAGRRASKLPQDMSPTMTVAIIQPASAYPDFVPWL